MLQKRASGHIAKQKQMTWSWTNWHCSFMVFVGLSESCESVKVQLLEWRKFHYLPKSASLHGPLCGHPCSAQNDWQHGLYALKACQLCKQAWHSSVSWESWAVPGCWKGGSSGLTMSDSGGQMQIVSWPCHDWALLQEHCGVMEVCPVCPKPWRRLMTMCLWISCGS